MLTLAARAVVLKRLAPEAFVLTIEKIWKLRGGKILRRVGKGREHATGYPVEIGFLKKLVKFSADHPGWGGLMSFFSRLRREILRIS